MVTEPIIAFTLRTTAVTESGWIQQTATTMEDDSIQSVEAARRQNCHMLWMRLTDAPPEFFSIRSTWRPPYDDMRVKINETIIKQDLMTGEPLSEREVEEYTMTYSAMQNR